MVRAMHAVRPGTRLGEATRRIASLVTDYPEPFDVEPLGGMETLQRSERVFSSSPVRMEDETLPASYVSTSVMDGPDTARWVDAIEDWTIVDAEVTLYHDEATLHHETWLHLDYTGSDESLTGETDSIFCAGVLEYGVTAAEAHDYLNDPDGRTMEAETVRERVKTAARVEILDIVLPDPGEPAYVRERSTPGPEASAYLDDRLSGDVAFDEEPVTALQAYTGDGYRIVAETGNGRTVFRPE